MRKPLPALNTTRTESHAEKEKQWDRTITPGAASWKSIIRQPKERTENKRRIETPTTESTADQDNQKKPWGMQKARLDMTHRQKMEMRATRQAIAPKAARWGAVQIASRARKNNQQRLQRESAIERERERERE